MAGQVRKLTEADYVRTPWKNGLGETVEVLRADRPGGAGGFDFDWRISVAPVTADGPFSTFPEIERTITVIEGAGMELTFETGERHMLLPFMPYTYDGGRRIFGRLLEGPVRDLNVMVRRGRWLSALEIVSGDVVVRTGSRVGEVAVVHALSGSWRTRDGGTPLCLAAGETLSLSGDTEIPLTAEAPGRLAMAHIAAVVPPGSVSS